MICRFLFVIFIVLSSVSAMADDIASLGEGLRHHEDGVLTDYYQRHKGEDSLYESVVKNDSKQYNDSIGDIVSISVGGQNDLNWSGVLGVQSPLVRDEVIVLPFLRDYPIENFEIRLRLLNKKF